MRRREEIGEGERGEEEGERRGREVRRVGEERERGGRGLFS